MKEQVHTDTESFVSKLVESMDLSEKIGQMGQYQGLHGHISDHLADDIRNGRVGSIINEVDPATVNELQRLAIEESRLGIPLLIGRDVIHGFKTIFPIPLAQAASWDFELVNKAARVSAAEASKVGVNWTFSPVVDVSRDPRWGRVAETFGEDPFLCSELACAMISGYQGEVLSDKDAIAACAKHFVGYGAVESGRDYATTNIADIDLYNTHLTPFKKAVDEGVATIMTSFCDINGMPASANRKLNYDVLRKQWGYDGMTVSDWDAIYQLKIHGIAENDADCAKAALNASIDMEMVSVTYRHHLSHLLETDDISLDQIDEAVTRIISLKYQLGLFDNPYVDPDSSPGPDEASLNLARKLASNSCVLLKNHEDLLPIYVKQVQRIAVIGPLADEPYEQLGTWIFDGEARHSTSCLKALLHEFGDDIEFDYIPALKHSRDNDTSNFDQAAHAASNADLVLLFVGEESLLSGEAHCRSDIRLPGAQESLIRRLKTEGTPIAAIILAGRPLVLTDVEDKLDSILMAWHPGSQAGPAIVDLLFGTTSPCGKLPVTFPRTVGQIPIYYAQKKGGKPVNEHNFAHMNDFPKHAPQTSMGMVSSHMDTYFKPLYPFGFGLTYGEIEYRNLVLDKHVISPDDSVMATIEIENKGSFVIHEVVQLYIRDKVASVTRPERELKGFTKVTLQPGQTVHVSMTICADQLKFYDYQNRYVFEPGAFEIWMGGDSTTEHNAEFTIVEDTITS